MKLLSLALDKTLEQVKWCEHCSKVKKYFYSILLTRLSAITGGGWGDRADESRVERALTPKLMRILARKSLCLTAYTSTLTLELSADPSKIYGEKRSAYSHKLNAITYAKLGTPEIILFKKLQKVGTLRYFHARHGLTLIRNLCKISSDVIKLARSRFLSVQTLNFHNKNVQELSQVTAFRLKFTLSSNRL